jgi:hypothetical protein
VPYCAIQRLCIQLVQRRTKKSIVCTKETGECLHYSFYYSTYQTRNLWLVTGNFDYLLFFFKGKVNNFYHDKILLRFMIFHAKDMYCIKVMHAFFCCWMSINNTFTRTKYWSIQLCTELGCQNHIVSRVIGI